MKLYNNDIPTWMKLVAFILIFIGMQLISGVVALSVMSLGADMLSVQAVSSLIGFGFSAFLYFLFFQKEGSLKKMFCTCFDYKWIICAVVLEICAMPAVSCLTVESDYGDMIYSLVSNTSLLGLAELIFCFAVLPAIFEELVFGGVLQKLFVGMTKRIWLGVILSSAVFSLFHMDMPNFFARFVLGLVLGLLYQYGGNIWINISFHFVNNLFATIQLWMLRKGMTDTSEEDFPLYLTVLSVLILVGFVVYNEMKNPKSLRKNYIKQTETDKDNCN